MQEWKLQLAPRWEALRAKGTLLGWHGEGSPYLHALASEHGLKWYEARGEDRVAEFMEYDADGLFNKLRSFGRIKCQHLIEVLETASKGVETPAHPEENHAKAFTLTCTEVLQLWEVPLDYPLKLVLLPTRLLNFCNAKDISSLPALLEAWGTIGRAGMLAQENIGRRTVDELQALAHAIEHADASSARRWLPLNNDEKGLCFRRALVLAHGRHTENERTIAARRIVDGLKLEEVGRERGITRERVRQLEAAFLGDVVATLDAFEAEKHAMLEAWMNGLEWKRHVIPLPVPESEILILAAIEVCFSESPQGMARRLDAESNMQSWIESAMTHPDLHLGGFNLQEFLDSNVPSDKHEEFISEIGNKVTLSVDYATGLVKPSSPCVRDSIQAILCQEEEPIPLTWLVRRVQSVEGCEDADAGFIFRNRYRWSQLGFIELSKIIWDQ